MRGKIILITGIMALGLSACGAQGSEPVGENTPENTISAESTVTEEATKEETTETSASEAVMENTAAAAETGNEEAEVIHWQDYGECSAVEKDFFNDKQEKTYYYQLDEFYFSDDKYAKVNDYLEQMYQKYLEEYEEEGESHTGAYEPVDGTLPEGQRYDYNYLVFNSITFIDDNYVSMRLNDTIYWAGAAHPQSYYAPVTISVETGEEVTPEEVLGKTWEEIRTAGGIEEESEAVFNEDYGFYLTDTELCYLYRFNYFVDEIRIPR